jgi:hypothetical protein
MYREAVESTSDTAVNRAEPQLAVKTTIVDTNIHPVAPPALRQTYPLDAYLGQPPRFSEDETNPIDLIVQKMNDAGIQQAFLSASRFHGFDNRYCADILQGRLDRFIGIANIDPFAADAPDQISYWIEKREACTGFASGAVSPFRGIAFPMQAPAPITSTTRNIGPTGSAFAISTCR